MEGRRPERQAEFLTNPLRLRYVLASLLELAEHGLQATEVQRCPGFQESPAFLLCQLEVPLGEGGRFGGRSRALCHRTDDAPGDPGLVTDVAGAAGVQ